jgi:hypothetical protein
MTAPLDHSASSTHMVPAGKNPLSSKKLLLSKWTAVSPVDKEEHFVVTRVVAPRLTGDPDGAGRDRGRPFRALGDVAMARFERRQPVAAGLDMKSRTPARPV